VVLEDEIEIDCGLSETDEDVRLLEMMGIRPISIKKIVVAKLLLVGHEWVRTWKTFGILAIASRRDGFDHELV
jgi:hypothetical protein